MAKKKFFQTAVGRVLKGAASIVAPGLVSSLENVKDVGQAIGIIRESTEIDDTVKLELERLALDQYRAEVDDRISARQREAVVAAAGGNDILFKSVGWGITLCFVAVVGAAIFNWVPEDNQRLFDMAFGAVVAAFTQVIGYYFGSSMGSKQKTNILNQ